MVRLRLTSDERATALARLIVPARAPLTRRLRLVAARRTVVVLRLPHPQGGLELRVTVRATDAAGNVGTAARRISPR